MKNRISFISAVILLVAAVLLGSSRLASRRAGASDVEGRRNASYRTAQSLGQPRSGINPKRRSMLGAGKQSMSSDEAMNVIRIIAEQWSEGQKNKTMEAVQEDFHQRLFGGVDEDGELEKEVARLAKLLSQEHAQELFDEFFHRPSSEVLDLGVFNVTEWIAYSAFQRLAALHPDAARLQWRDITPRDGDQVGTHDAVLTRALALGWSQKNPEKALHWWQAHEHASGQGHSFFPSSHLLYSGNIEQELYRLYAQVNYRAALADALKERSGTEAELAAGDRADEGDADEITLRQKKKLAAQLSCLSGVIEGLPEGLSWPLFAEKDFERLRQQLRQRGINERQDQQLAESLALRWLSEDAAAAMDWYSEHESTAEKNRPLTLASLDDQLEVISDVLPDGSFLLFRFNLVQQWADQDPESFLEWAGRQSHPEQAVSFYFDGRHADKALAFTAGLKTEVGRVDLLQQVIRESYQKAMNNHQMDPFADFNELNNDVDLTKPHKDYYQRVVRQIGASPMEPAEKYELLNWLEVRQLRDPNAK